MNNKLKILNIVLLVLIIIGLGLIFTREKWVPGLVDFIISFEKEEIKTDIGSKWTGKINSVKTDCIFDGVCSVIVSGQEVMIIEGMRTLGPNEEIGKLLGVESIGDIENYIGKNANVYAKRNSDGIYTIYGSKDFYVEILK